MKNIYEPVHNKAFSKIRGDVLLIDVFPITDGEMLKLTFESKSSEWRQGVRLAADVGLEINQQYMLSALLWYGAAPNPLYMKCRTKNGLLVVYNIWDRGGGANSQAHSSGMVVEIIPLGKRYKCNDIGFDTGFDKLIFKLEHMQG